MKLCQSCGSARQRQPNSALPLCGIENESVLLVTLTGTHTFSIAEIYDSLLRVMFSCYLEKSGRLDLNQRPPAPTLCNQFTQSIPIRIFIFVEILQPVGFGLRPRLHSSQVWIFIP